MTCNGRLPAMTNTWESTNVPDLYFAGTLMQVLDYQKTHSNVIHGFRFNIKAMSQMFGQKYHIAHLFLPILKLISRRVN